MKKLILASLAVAATLASCEKSVVVDPALTTNQEIQFSPYAGASATKGTPVNSNANFQGTEDSYGSFEVAAYNGEASYFGFSTVTYNGSSWGNTDDMYWPNKGATLHFAAYYPSTATFLTNKDASSTLSYAYNGAHALAFGYQVGALASQVDLMYAITDNVYTAPTTGGVSTQGTENDENDETAEYKKKVALNFKHALTQIAFTATKDSDLDVKVEAITLCNIVDNGTFSATQKTDDTGATNVTIPEASVDKTNFGTWTAASVIASASTNLAVYKTAIAHEASKGYITVGTTKTTLTSATDVLMLIPQALTNPWDPTVANNNNGTDSYLAIDCVITHAGSTSPIIDGRIYVPFSSNGITYNLGSGKGDDTWLPGYKITYNLNFGGGYTKPGDTTDTDPKPGTTPTPDEVLPTLRPITYTVTVDEWITDINGSGTTDADDDTDVATGSTKQ